MRWTGTRLEPLGRLGLPSSGRPTATNAHWAVAVPPKGHSVHCWRIDSTGPVDHRVLPLPARTEVHAVALVEHTLHVGGARGDETMCCWDLSEAVPTRGTAPRPRACPSRRAIDEEQAWVSQPLQRCQRTEEGVRQGGARCPSQVPAVGWRGCGRHTATGLGSAAGTNTARGRMGLVLDPACVFYGVTGPFSGAARATMMVMGPGHHPEQTKPTV